MFSMSTLCYGVVVVLFGATTMGCFCALVGGFAALVFTGGSGTQTGALIGAVIGACVGAVVTIMRNFTSAIPDTPERIYQAPVPGDVTVADVAAEPQLRKDDVEPVAAGLVLPKKGRNVSPKRWTQIAG